MGSVPTGFYEHQTLISLTPKGDASLCSKAYLFLPGRCCLARLVKPENVDQKLCQAHCAAESFLDGADIVPC